MKRDHEGKGVYIIEEKNVETVCKVIGQFVGCYDNPYISEENKRRQYAVKIIENGVFLTAYYEKKPVGFVCGYVNDQINRCAYISFLMIKPEIGIMQGDVLNSLLYEAIKYAQRRGMEQIRAEVAKDNMKAQKLYRKLGMKVVGDASPESVYMESELAKCAEFFERFKRKVND